MAMFKHVAGVGKVEMKAEEETAWLAESKANEPAKQPPPPPQPPEEKLVAFLRANPDVLALIES